MTRSNTGIIYISFGPNSLEAAKESIASIRRLGIEYPIISVGTYPIPGTEFHEWKDGNIWGDHPWRGHRFLAGKVKPFLYKYTTYKYNLYLDADTEAIENFDFGFKYLEEYDVCVADDTRRPLEMTYVNIKTEPEWDWAREERDFTIKYLDQDNTIMINSGIIFFRLSQGAKNFFDNWYAEWLRWAQWDEQMALLRAEHNCTDTKILRLPSHWNEHNPDKRRIFWHKWGSARDYRILFPEKQNDE
jgi:hypothetical protein